MAQLGDTIVQGDLRVTGNMLGLLPTNGEFSVNPTASAGSYNEGIRLNKASNNWAALMIGSNRNTTSGSPEETGGWFVGCNTSQQLVVGNKDSSTANAALWIDTNRTVHVPGGIVGALSHRGNAGKSNMNDIGRLYPSAGMTSLSDPGNTVDNPLNGTTKSTGGHLYFDTSYSDDPSGGNAWVGQICNKAGTAQWWVRSRAGSTITNGTAWAAPWEHLTIAPQAGQGSGTQPIYVDSNGHTQNCTYALNKTVPSDATFTDTKVTSSANHYTPATASGSDKTASASGATAAWSIDVVKGVTLNTDGKGHVTGLSVTSGKIPANPNTDNTVKATAKTDNVNYKILATASSSPTSGGLTEAVYDTDITLNPSTNTIAANISGQAEKAYKTSGGIVIDQRFSGIESGMGSINTAVSALQDSMTSYDRYRGKYITYYQSSNVATYYRLMTLSGFTMASGTIVELMMHFRVMYNGSYISNNVSSLADSEIELLLRISNGAVYPYLSRALTYRKPSDSQLTDAKVTLHQDNNSTGTFYIGLYIPNKDDTYSRLLYDYQWWCSTGGVSVSAVPLWYASVPSTWTQKDTTALWA